MEQNVTQNGTQNGITEGQILNTLDAGYRTIGGIKKRLNIPPYKDIGEDLNSLVESGKIIRFDNGQVTAFFRSDEKPTKIWVLGDGRVSAQFDEDLDKKPDPEKPGRRAPDIDAAIVEQFAAEGKTVKDLAEHLGLGVYAFKNYLTKKSTKPEVRDAWHRGCETAVTNGVKKARVSAPRGPYKKTATKSERVATPAAALKAPKKPDVELTETDLPAATILPGQHMRFIELEHGSVVISFHGNIFDLRGREWDLVIAIGELLEKFEAGKSEA